MTQLDRDLEAIAKTFIPKVRDAFLQNIKNIRDSVVLREFVDALEVGDINTAMKLLGLSPAALRDVTAAIETAYELGGVTVTKTFPKLPNATVFLFDVRNSQSERFLREQSSELITSIADDTRNIIRDRLSLGMLEGRNPKNVGLDLIGRMDNMSRSRVGGVIGLNRPQEKFVRLARLELQNLDENYFNRVRRDARFDNTVRKAIVSGKPLSVNDVNRIVGRYSDRLLQLRAETIGRDQMLTSLNRAEFDAYHQVLETGEIKPDAVKRIWDSVGPDGRTRDSHLAMEGQSREADEPFTTPAGHSLMFPGDTSLGAPPAETIQCRCKVRTKVDWFSGVD